MSKRTPILIVENSTGVGGSTVSLLRLVSRMRDGDFSPHVVFYRPNSYLSRFKEMGIETTAIERAAVPGECVSTAAKQRKRTAVRSLAGSVQRAVRKDLRDALRIRTLIKQKGAQLVHVNGRFSSCRGAILASRLARVPCVCHVRDFYSLGPVDRRFAGWVDSFLYISRAVMDHMEAIVPGASGHLVYDGLDEADFREDVDWNNERGTWGLRKGDLVVGDVGRLVEWKGQHVFLEALSQISADLPGLKALVVGEPDPPEDLSYLRRLRDLTERLGLQDRVVFTGFVEDIPRLLATFDVLVHSSVRPEPFGLTILEGMAAGLPVIATAAGGALDLVQDGVTGRLVSPGNAHDMGEALCRTLLEPDQGARMGRAGRDRVAREFSIESFVGGVEHVYASVLSQGPPRQRLGKLK